MKIVLLALSTGVAFLKSKLLETDEFYSKIFMNCNGKRKKAKTLLQGLMPDVSYLAPSTHTV